MAWGTRDYTSFSAAAKTRFRGMAAELAYEQLTGVTYVRPRDGWYELFYLQASSWGNPFFYFNSGAVLPDRFPLGREDLKNHGWLLGRRLDHPGGAFPCATKAEIEASAKYALHAYMKVAVPWFNTLTLGALEQARAQVRPGRSDA